MAVAEERSTLGVMYLVVANWTQAGQGTDQPLLGSLRGESMTVKDLKHPMIPGRSLMMCQTASDRNFMRWRCGLSARNTVIMFFSVCLFIFISLSFSLSLFLS